MHPILHYVKLHTGTDFAVRQRVLPRGRHGPGAVHDGQHAYGNFTVIDHGMRQRPAHHDLPTPTRPSSWCKPGDVVAKGQKIGIIGSTGYATGPHLHFEVRDDGAVEDPMTWLR